MLHGLYLMLDGEIVEFANQIFILSLSLRKTSRRVGWLLLCWRWLNPDDLFLLLSSFILAFMKRCCRSRSGRCIILLDFIGLNDAMAGSLRS